MDLTGKSLPSDWVGETVQSSEWIRRASAAAYQEPVYKTKEEWDESFKAMQDVTRSNMPNPYADLTEQARKMGAATGQSMAEAASSIAFNAQTKVED